MDGCDKWSSSPPAALTQLHTEGEQPGATKKRSEHFGRVKYFLICTPYPILCGW